MPKISLIAAIGKTTRAIGKNNQLLWKIPEDLQRFKKLTSGHPIIMGRKTFESIGRPLPNRTNIVVTRNKNFTANGCIIVNSLESALEKAGETNREEIFIIGGAEIYNRALPLADKLYLTIVESDAEGDAFFPEYQKDFNKIIFKQEGISNGLKYTFLDLEK